MASYSRPTMITDHSRQLVYKLTGEAKAAFGKQPGRGEIEAALDKEAERDNQPARAKTTLSPSELSVKACNLEVYFKFFPHLYMPVDPQTPAIRRQWNRSKVLGNALHDAWQKALIASDAIAVMQDGSSSVEAKVYDFASEKRKLDIQTRKFTQYSRIDFLLDPFTSGEIKGIAAKDFNPLDRYFFEKLKTDQAQLYMFFLGLKKTHYIAVNRDAQNWFDHYSVFEFELYRDDEHITDILWKAEDINQTVAEEKPPEPAPPGGNTYYCKSLCSFKIYCSLGRGL